MNPTPEEALFAAALDRSPSERAEFLDSACAGNPDLRLRVEALLDSHDATANPLATQAKSAPTVQIGFPDEPEDDAVGQTLGRYKLLEKIGEGGCGVVYVAEQTQPVRRRVALKVIKLGMDTKQVVARFEAERQALALMDHPNIAKVLDAGTTDRGRPFFVMELVRGIRITDYCDQANLSTHDRLELFIKVCQAIQHAHQKGIIHRDIKPSNILVTLHDGVPVPKVIDFGIAKATEGRLTDATVYTQLHQFIGTPAYMSPEQAEMSGLDIDTRSDIYSLGVLLYELLAGSTPFDARELMASGIDAMRRTIREKEPPRPSTRLTQAIVAAEVTRRAGGNSEPPATSRRRLLEQANLIRGDLDWIVMKCLEKDRQRRYETANGLAADLRRHLGNEPVAARPPSTTYRLQKSWRRNRLMFTAAGVALISLMAGLGLIWASARREASARVSESIQRSLAEKRQQEAESARSIAEASQQRADGQARKAMESEAYSRRLLYAADMNLAQQALSQNNVGRARRLLDRHRPAAGEEDLRGWEWRHLWQQCRSEALTTLTQRPLTQGFSLSFSPDGSLLAVGYLDGRTEIWNVTRQSLVRHLSGDGEPGHVAFSPRSNLLAATAGLGLVKLHNLTTGGDQMLRQVPGSIREVSFTPDGSAVLTFSQRQDYACAVLHDPSHTTPPHTNSTTGANAHMGSARITSDGTRGFLSRGRDTTRDPHVSCIEWASGRELWTSDLGPDGGLTAMSLSPDDRILATATGYEGTLIEIRDTTTGKVLTRLAGHSRWVADLHFSADGRSLISASADQTVRMWDCTDWKEVRVFRGHGDEVRAAAISPDGSTIASTSRDGTVLLWEVKPRTTPYGHRLLPPETAFCTELEPGSLLAISDDSLQRIRLNDLVTTPVRIDLGTNLLNQFLGRGLFAFYDRTNSLTVWDVRDSPRILLNAGIGANLTYQHDLIGFAFALSPRESLIAWGETNGTVHIASLAQPGKRWQWMSELRHVEPRLFSADGRLVVLSGKGSTRSVEVRDVSTGRLIFSPEMRFSGPTALLLAADGHVLIAIDPGNPAGDIHFWDMTQPQNPPVSFTERGSLSSGAISPDGRWLALGTRLGTAIVYDAVAMKRRDILHGHMLAIDGLAFSPDNQRLITGATGHEAVKLWQLSTGQELLTLPGRGALLRSPSFVEDGNTLLLGAGPGTWQFWRAPSWDVIQAAEAKEERGARKL